MLDRYVSLRVIGRGAFGEVCEARDQVTGDIVAVKKIEAPLAEHAVDVRALFQRARALSHPNIVRLRELIEGDNLWHVVMDRIEGIDLLPYVRGDLETIERVPNIVMGQRVDDVAGFGPCSLAGLLRLRRVLPGIATGLATLHAHRLCHRDVSAANVMIEDDRPILIDLGLASSAAVGTAQGVAMAGAATNLPPEAGDGDPAGPEGDWYALGVLLFEMLTGGQPFSGSAQEVMIKKRTVRAPRPSFVVASVPPDLDDLCDRLLERSPKLRASAQEVLERLRRGEGSTT
ncbi:MAG: serine/threonine-protein kinase [Polyangiaceae bacterium]